MNALAIHLYLIIRYINLSFNYFCNFYRIIAVRILKLNQFILKMVRRIWFFCTDNGLNPHGGNRDEIINTMFGFLDAGEANEANMLMNFKKDKYWNLLLQYDAFATIRHI